MSFIFSLSSIKALHCSLMGLTTHLRPHPPLLEEKKSKKLHFPLAASAGCWPQVLWRRRWQQGCVSGSERLDVWNRGSAGSFLVR